MNNKPLIYVTLFSISWAFSILISKLAIRGGANPISLTPQTLLFTTLIIGTYLFFTKTFRLTRTSRTSIYGSLISGLIGGGLANFASVYGLKFTTSINAGFIVKTATAFTVIFAYFILKEPISKLKGLFVGLLLLGAYLLSTGSKAILPHTGDIFILFAAVGFALAAVLNRKYIKKDIHPDMVSLFRALMGLLTTFVLAMALGVSPFNFDMINYILLISVFQSGIYIFLNRTLSVASASYMTMMSMITPVTVAIVAIPVFGESLSMIQWIGAGLIVFAGIMTQVKGLANHD